MFNHYVIHYDPYLHRIGMHNICASYYIYLVHYEEIESLSLIQLKEVLLHFGVNLQPRR